MIKLGTSDLSKAYIGSTEVSKMYLGSELVYENNPFIIPYITDGLVFYLDGINKGGNSNKWTDLIGGRYFTYNSTYCTVKEKSVYMNGKGGLIGSSPMDFSSAGTVECCFNRPSAGGCVVFMPKGTSYLAFLVTGAGYAYKPSSNPANQYPVTRVPILTCSLHGSFGMLNGTKLTTRNTNYYNTNNTTYATLGSRGSNGYPMTGDIHSLRIYNRQLTEAEMLFNQKVDNERFELGLTLPDTI